METDWKDMLESLKNSGSLPIDDTPEIEEKKPETGIQKAPVTVLTDRKGRNGKTATIIEGLLCDENEVENLAKRLKQRLGTGGSTRDGEILIQGDRKKEVGEILKSLGYKVKFGN